MKNGCIFKTIANRIRKANVSPKAISTTLLFLVLFNMLIVVSVAWFSMNRKTDSDNLGMSLTVDDTSATYTVYKYDSKTEKGTSVIDGVPISIETLELNQYDSIFAQQNRYTPAIVRISISVVNSSVINDEGTVTVEINRKSNGDDDYLSDYTSSISRYSCFVDNTNFASDDELYSAINSDTRYNQIRGLTADNEYSKTFVHAIESGGEYTYTKVDNITITCPYDADDWVTVDGKNVLNIYLYISYDSLLINLYNLENGTENDALGEDSTVYYANDLKYVSVWYD